MFKRIVHASKTNFPKSTVVSRARLTLFVYTYVFAHEPSILWNKHIWAPKSTLLWNPLMYVIAFCNHRLFCLHALDNGYNEQTRVLDINLERVQIQNYRFHIERFLHNVSFITSFTLLNNVTTILDVSGTIHKIVV